MYEINTAETAVITDYVGAETALVVPDTLGGYKVTEIGKFAFHYCSEIISITLPTGITTIGDYAFNKCNRLTRIVSLYLTLLRTFIAITKTAPLLKKPVVSMAMPMPMVL